MYFDKIVGKEQITDVYIENTNSDEDGKGDKKHGEEEIFAKQGDSERGWRNNLGKKQEEHSEREENRNTKSDLDKE